MHTVVVGRYVSMTGLWDGILHGTLVIFRVEGFGNSCTWYAESCTHGRGSTVAMTAGRLQVMVCLTLAKTYREAYRTTHQYWMLMTTLKRYISIPPWYLRLYFRPSQQSKEAKLAMTTEPMEGHKTANKIISRSNSHVSALAKEFINKQHHWQVSRNKDNTNLCNMLTRHWLTCPRRLRIQHYEPETYLSTSKNMQPPLITTFKSKKEGRTRTNANNFKNCRLYNKLLIRSPLLHEPQLNISLLFR